jgi:hypothetical protein
VRPSAPAKTPASLRAARDGDPERAAAIVVAAAVLAEVVAEVVAEAEAEAAGVDVKSLRFV